MQDENDRHRAGQMPHDPEDGTEDMDPPPTESAPLSELPPTLGEQAHAAVAKMRARHAGTDKPIPVPWDSLAAPLGGGFWPGTISILVGTTGAGKTQLSLQIALAAANAGHPTYYLALEADDVEFPARAIGLAANVPWGELWDGSYKTFDFDAHLPALDGLPLHVDYAPPHAWRPQALAGIVPALRAKYPEAAENGRPPLVIIDYLQVIGTEGGEDLRERISRAAYAFREVARTHQAAVIVASTARANYDKLRGEDKEALGQGSAARFLNYAKESGDVEYSAHSVIVITQEPWEAGATSSPLCWLALAKVRAKKPAWVPLRFDGRAFSEPGAPRPLPGTPTR